MVIFFFHSILSICLSKCHCHERKKIWCKWLSFCISLYVYPIFKNHQPYKYKYFINICSMFFFLDRVLVDFVVVVAAICCDLNRLYSFMYIMCRVQSESDQQKFEGKSVHLKYLAWKNVLAKPRSSSSAGCKSGYF